MTEQEPVAWLHTRNHGGGKHTKTLHFKKPPEPRFKALEWIEPLVHPQPKRESARSEWVGLTDEEIDQGLLRSDYALQNAHAWRAGVVFAMTKLKEKNT